MLVDGYHLVSVRAFDRPGFDGFCRGGRRWSSKESTFALVTPALLAVLKAEKMLAVDTGVALDASALELVGRYDVPKQLVVDPIAVALDESRRLKAEKAALEALAENEKLKAEIE
jgi:hydroxymethylpyrimidine/phosphomethylpyrimidine kinase